MNWPTENSPPRSNSALESLDGWIGDTRSDSWEEGYQHLVSHIAQHGDARVSDGYRTPDGFLLGRWVSHQRIAFGNSKLSLDRRRRLESLPGCVGCLSGHWDRRYEEVATYARDHGTSAVPQSYRTAEGFRLGSWVSNQRTAFAKNKLDPERQQRLESLPGWGVANAVMAPVRHPRGHRDGRSVSYALGRGVEGSEGPSVHGPKRQRFPGAAPPCHSWHVRPPGCPDRMPGMTPRARSSLDTPSCECWRRRHGRGVSGSTSAAAPH